MAMTNNFPESTPRSTNQYDRLDPTDELERVYPYPAIPRSVRPYLERCFEIDDINNIDPANAKALTRLDRLKEINDTLGLMRAYCREELNGSAYKAAALGVIEDSQDGLGDKQHPSNRAAEELGRFFINNTPDDEGILNDNNVYIAGLLQDRRRLDKLREQARSSIDEMDYVNGAPAPSASEWLADPAITDADTLHNTVETINIESVLISGVETLIKLRDHAVNDRATLDLVRYSEQIVAPIAEVIGFDTLAMSLNSMTKTIRLENGGRGYLLHRANAMIDRFRSYDRGHSLAHNVVSIFNDVTSDVLGDTSQNLMPSLPVNYGDDNQAVYGDTPVKTIDTANGPVEASWRFRLKTPGSLAWKMYQREKKGKDSSVTSMDVLGITAVVNNDDDQIKLFQSMVNGLYNSDRLQPHPSPTKISPVHIRGRGSYINNMVDGIQGVDVDSIDRREVDSAEALHYAKVTGFYSNLPFEIQCVTRFYRDSMQIGPLAHIIYKAQKVGKMSHAEVERWTKLLADIRSRRSRLGEIGLVGSIRDPQTNELVKMGGNELQAGKFVEELTSLSNVTNNTIGFIASTMVMNGVGTGTQ